MAKRVRQSTVRKSHERAQRVSIGDIAYRDTRRILRLRHGLADWGLLLALTVLWGSAFVFTKIAVAAIPSRLVVAGRLAIAASLLVPLAMVLASRVPSSRRLWLFLVLIALFGNVLPFMLITWGQASIDSGLAGILMAVMPLGTLSLAHFFVPGERLTPYRVFGFFAGLAGVVVIMGPESLAALVHGSGQFLPMFAVLCGAFCYALSSILARMRPSSDILSTAAATTLLATLMAAPFAFGTGQFDLRSLSVSALASVAVLGAFSTALATVVYFKLIKSAGPTFVSQLNYLIPVWAVMIGVLLLGEHPQVTHLVGLILILGGILISQLEGVRRSDEGKTCRTKQVDAGV